MHKLAEKYNFKIHETKYSIFVTTSIGHWRIDLDDNISLWHENFLSGKKSGTRYDHDYHFQRKFGNLEECFGYIHNHDKRKYKGAKNGK